MTPFFVMIMLPYYYYYLIIILAVMWGIKLAKSRSTEYTL
jgi:hypothetical protein